jgi:hypothetical protein
MPENNGNMHWQYPHLANKELKNPSYSQIDVSPLLKTGQNNPLGDANSHLIPFCDFTDNTPRFALTPFYVH